MYKIDLNIGENNKKSIEIKQLKNIFSKSSHKYEDFKDFNLKEVFNKLDYGMNILEYYPNKKDYIFTYTHPIFWDDYIPNLHKQLKGRLLTEAIPLLKDLNFQLKKEENLKQKDLKITLKKEDELLKAWTLTILYEKEHIYLNFQDKTEDYMEKIRIETIFNNSNNPIININKKGQLIRYNNALIKCLGYNKHELENINFSNIVLDFKTNNPLITSFKEYVKLLFNQKKETDNFELLLKTKNNKNIWMKTHLNYVDNNILDLFLQDLSNLKKYQEDVNNINEYLADIEDTSKTVFDITDREGFHWHDSVYDILEIDSKEDKEYITHDNIILRYASSETNAKVKKELEKLTLNNPIRVEYEIITAKGNLKYLRAFVKLKKVDNEILRLGFTQDITDEVLAQKEALSLKENMGTIEEFSKIFMANFTKEGVTFTSEIYNILGIKKEDYENNNLLEFVIPEDREALYDLYNNVSVDNPSFVYIYRVKTAKDEIKYINTYDVATFDENGEYVKLTAFQQDITEQVLFEMKASRLSENFKLIENSSKVAIAEYENGYYTFTDEIYNILAINKEDYPPTVNVLENFVLPEYKDEWSKLLHLTPTRNEAKLTYSLLNADGKIKHIFSQSKAIFDNNCELVRIVGFLQDVTSQIIAEEKSFELADNLKIIEGFSKISIGEYENGHYSFTDEIYNICEISPDLYDYDDLLDLIVDEDLELFKNYMDNVSYENPNFTYTYRIITGKGNLKYLTSKCLGKFNEDKDLIKIVGFIQDITDEVNARESAIQLEKDLNIIQSSSKIVLAHYKNNEHFFTSEIYNILEIDPEVCPTGEDIVHSYLINEFNSDFLDKILKINYLNPNLHDVVKIVTPKGNLKVLECFIEAEFDENHVLSEIVGFLQEITDKVEREEELSRLSEDRKILLQEVHHRVKNNLQLILSFLNLESRYHSADPEYVIEQTRNRIRTMALTHEEVYQSPSVSKVNLESFINTGISNLFHLYTEGSIVPHLSIEPIELDVDKSIPLGLLINELSLNSMKYAFPDTGEGDFYISLKKLDDNIVMRVWDNGIGLPDDFSFEDSTGLGFIIVQSLIRQLEGDFVLLDDCVGFGIELTFPL